MRSEYDRSQRVLSYSFSYLAQRYSTSTAVSPLLSSLQAFLRFTRSSKRQASTGFEPARNRWKAALLLVFNRYFGWLSTSRSCRSNSHGIIQCQTSGERIPGRFSPLAMTQPFDHWTQGTVTRGAGITPTRFQEPLLKSKRSNSFEKP